VKKLFLLLVLIALSVAIGYSLKPKNKPVSPDKVLSVQKREILRFAIVADSENDNDLLAKALLQAKGAGVNFVVGLGDWTTVGTDEQLADVKRVFDQSGFTYYLTSGDHDVWDSRDKQKEALTNFREVFGEPNHLIEKNGVKIIVIDNSDIYKGMNDETWNFLKAGLEECRGPVTSFLPVSAPLRVSFVRHLQVVGEVRAAGNPSTGATPRICFVMAHKTPFHPESSHVMGEESARVTSQAKMLLDTLINSNVSGFFSGDMHFFAQFKSADGKLPITTVGAVAKEKNFQGPRFAIVKVFNDYTWQAEDVEIR